MRLIHYNGAVIPAGSPVIPAHHAALRSGTSLIETMLWEHGAIRFWEAHMERLAKGMALLQWDRLCRDSAGLLLSVKELVIQNKIPAGCVVRLQVFPEQKQTGFLIETLPLPDASHSLKIGIAKGVRRNFDDYSALKTGARLPYVLARRQAEEQGWADALILNHHNRIAESAVANVFWIKNNVLYTPPLTEGCVAGVYRSQVCSGRLLPPRIRVSEKTLTIRECTEADGLLLTNAVRGIQIVTSLVTEEEEISFGKDAFPLLVRSAGYTGAFSF